MRATSAFSVRSARSAAGCDRRLGRAGEKLLLHRFGDGGARRPLTHMPAPGSLAATSGTILPSGAGDKADQAMSGMISPVTMQRRSRIVDRFVLFHFARRRRHQASASPSSGASSSDFFFRHQLLDPADLDARLHDDGVGVVGGEIEAFQRARNAHALLVLAGFVIAQQIVGGRSPPDLPAS